MKIGPTSTASEQTRVETSNWAEFPFVLASELLPSNVDRLSLRRFSACLPCEGLKVGMKLLDGRKLMKLSNSF